MVSLNSSASRCCGCLRGSRTRGGVDGQHSDAARGYPISDNGRTSSAELRRHDASSETPSESRAILNDPCNVKQPGLTVPDTHAARASLEIATSYYSPSLLNHCLRSYHWSSLLAKRNGITFDDELLYVAAMLHDLGLVRAFDNYAMSFEHVGAELAWLFGAGVGWDEERRTHVGEAIISHMADDLPTVGSDVESHLLGVATAADISATGIEAWPEEERLLLMTQFPRLELRTEFTACFESQARRKPHTSPAAALENGIAQRIATNPLDRLSKF